MDRGVRRAGAATGQGENTINLIHINKSLQYDRKFVIGCVITNLGYIFLFPV